MEPSDQLSDSRTISTLLSDKPSDRRTNAIKQIKIARIKERWVREKCKTNYRGSALSVNPLFQLQARVTGNPHRFCSTNPINENRYKKFTIHSAWFSQTINLLSLLATHNHSKNDLSKSEEKIIKILYYFVRENRTEI